MAAITLQTARQFVPMIYAYTTPEIRRHDGWTKIGYTEQAVEQRLKQQTHTADVLYEEQWRGSAQYDDGSGEYFKDTDFHAYLRKIGIENSKENEWFHIGGTESRHCFYEFRANHGRVPLPDVVTPYRLRAEQAEAVQKTRAYFESHPNGEFLWNAKPRFGKTLAVYDLCKQMNLTSVLVVTNRPAIANSWYSDYVKFLGRGSGYLFVSHVDALAGQPYVLDRNEYVDAMMEDAALRGCIEFVSLQDLKGSVYFGGEHDKLNHIIRSDSDKPLCWDLLVVDEAHEGVDTYKTDIAFERITRKHTLHLSGTPFKALANDKFPADAIYNWTYADEQQAKRSWQGEAGDMNPYAALPKLNLFTYQMSEIVRDELKRGVEIDGKTEEYAFDLADFFKVRANGEFEHETSVDRFLDALTTQEKFPFSTEELRAELKHTFWLLNRVDSARALAKKLKEHPIFRDYEIVLAAGDGRLDEAEETRRSYDKVVEAIKQHEKTITLSVGQLTTGVTIPEWSGVLMLSNLKSPALYMQAAFRSQNPWSYSVNGKFYRKQNAYVFDFDPARTLIIFEQFANDLCAGTADGRGDSTTRKDQVRTLLNFFPVIGEDEEGRMVELNAEQVLSIPRKIKSKEVVRRGFMSDFLFQNISNIFHAPQEVIDIIQSFRPTAEPRKNAEVGVTPSTGEDLSLNEDGEVSLEEGYVIGRSADVFGDKIYEEVQDEVYDAIDHVSDEDSLTRLKQAAHTAVVGPVMERAKEEYGRDLRPSDQRRFEAKAREELDQAVSRAYDNHKIEQKTRELERQKALDAAQTEKEKQQIDRQYDARQKKADMQLQHDLLSIIDDERQKTQREIVRAVETGRREQEKKGYEDAVRDHLRGFARTIPSFLMAYGDEHVTLRSFDRIIPENVFFEVTSITLEQFRFLRDGGPYINARTGEKEHFAGHLFDPIVFDDSVREFLQMKEKLANYFDETNTEDIFDYIPPQKTNQIFTPKWVVKKMADDLEEENPGCFDDPDKTFIDLYMKSGLYIAEIVKRLYRSANMKKLYPDGNERLRHIFEKQVYGLAPTEIIYHIAKNFILGFAGDASVEKHNLRLLDALEYAKEGTLEKKMEEVFG